MITRPFVPALRGLCALVLLAPCGVAQPVPPAAAGSTDDHTFLAVRADGAPVSYDSCRPVHVVVNSDGAPGSGSLRLVLEALDEAARASGLRFVYDGPTSERPPAAGETRESRQPERYGDDWAPVLIVWSSPAEVPRLAGSTLALGGSRAAVESGQLTYVTGSVTLDGPALAWRLTHPDGSAYVRAVLLHELGHLLGLGHVTDPGELMYPVIGARLGLGPGDRRGLAELGGDCPGG